MDVLATTEATTVAVRRSERGRRLARTPVTATRLPVVPKETRSRRGRKTEVRAPGTPIGGASASLPRNRGAASAGRQGLRAEPPEHEAEASPAPSHRRQRRPG